MVSGTTTTVGDFVVRNTDCPYPSQPSLPVISAMVGPPSICQFEVGFAPVASGARSQAMTFIDTGGPTGTLQLTGTGIAPSSTAPITAPRKKCKKKRTAAAAKKKCKKAKALS